LLVCNPRPAAASSSVNPYEQPARRPAVVGFDPRSSLAPILHIATSRFGSMPSDFESRSWGLRGPCLLPGNNVRTAILADETLTG
jgi:hypothetical protein